MNVRHVLRSHRDWVVLAFICLAVLIAGLLIANLLMGRGQNGSNLEEPSPRNYPSQPSGYPEIVKPDKKFPPPAKEQRNFYELYTAGNIQYSIVWSNRNVERNPLIGAHKFTVELYNTRNEPLTVSGNEAEQVTVGCIASSKPYRKQTVETQTINLAALEKKQLVFDIDVSCMYLGTADGKYFWRIY